MDASLSETQKKKLIDDSEKIYFDTQLNFIKGHNGHRPGKLHLYIGAPGGGKSTLVRTLLIDVLSSNDEPKKILVWLSEEDINDFKLELARSRYSEQKKLAHVTIISEQSLSEGILDLGIYFIEEVSKHDIVIYDNITTSQLYMDKRPYEQSAFAKKLKNLAQKYKCVMIIFAHTSSDAILRGKLLDENCIRGSKTIVNLAEFLYIMQRFQMKDEFFPTLRILKHRGQPHVQFKLFSLVYHPKVNLYVGVTAIKFEELKKVFQARDTL